MKPLAKAALGLVLLIVAGCQSTVDPKQLDLTPDQYFQRAIDASEKDNYRLALSYYEAFQAKFPDDLERNAWASYEIAFLYHKLGNDAKAIELFDKLLQRYADQKEGSPQMPPGPRVLAQKVKGNILKHSPRPAAAPEAAPAPPPPAPGAPAPAAPGPSN
jgi:tetratricopeptide (TPR) repeat protein